MPFKSGRYAAAQTDTVIVTAGTTGRIKVRELNLSVPAGQNANFEFDLATDVMILSTETRAVTRPPNDCPVVGDANSDLILTSSGAVSYAVLYEIIK